MSKPIGILGGTFDPVHHGHLRLALEIVSKLDLDEVRLIPLKKPAHRQEPFATEKQRLHMLQLATEGSHDLIADDRELKRDEVSYSIDTLRSLRKEFPDRALCLIVGQDAFSKLDTWKEWQGLLDYAHIIVATRPDGNPVVYNETIADLLQNHETNNINKLHKEKNKLIMQLDIPLLDISSTLIRKNFSDKKDCRYLLPNSVIEYIKQESLYV